MPDDQDDRLHPPKADGVLRVLIVVVVIMAALVAWVALSGCTFVGINRGNLDLSEKDSHDAQGTNRSHTFDVNFSPR